MRAVVFGAGGFIGSHLTARLLRDGLDVVGLDVALEKVEELRGAPRLRLVEADIREATADLDAWVGSADVVIDLIAHATPATYVAHPLEVFSLNFQENLRIAEACSRHERRLVQLSSCEVYGKTPAALLGGQLPDAEDPSHATFAENQSHLILGPVAKHRWIYACAKQLLERVLHAYGLEGRLTYTIVRPFNFIGPKIDHLPGENGATPRVFSHFMEALLQGSPMRLVDGGHHRRCFTYIDDAVDALARIVDNPGGVCDGEIFNVGNPGNELSVRQLAELMRDLYAGHFAPPGARLPDLVEVAAADFYGDGYDDSDRRIPDITKARQLLGWEPRHDVRETLLRSMAYYAGAARVSQEATAEGDTTPRGAGEPADTTPRGAGKPADTTPRGTTEPAGATPRGTSR